jgi:GNAT superfamily N-acetyltransferase
MLMARKGRASSDKGTMRIEPAAVTDADTLARLNEHVHRLHVDNAPRFFRVPTRDEAVEAFRTMLARPAARAFIAYVDHVAAGYALAFLCERAGGAFSPARRWIHVENVSVDPAWQRRGIARALVSAVERCAIDAGIEEIELDTWAFNARAQTLFRSWGFEPKIQRFWMRTTP